MGIAGDKPRQREAATQNVLGNVAAQGWEREDFGTTTTFVWIEGVFDSALQPTYVHLGTRIVLTRVKEIYGICPGILQSHVFTGSARNCFL
jgi:hypothetical protein